MRRERIIRCGTGADGRRGRLSFEIDGEPQAASLRIDRLAQRLVADLPDRVVDLLEVAAFVYAADAAIGRGGPSDRQMGAAWRRSLVFEIPVRDPEFWNGTGIVQALVETLTFLSDDGYRFAFVPHRAPPAGERYFGFRSDEGFAPDEALLFSGGLDSLAGALEELFNRRSKVLLVSHHSAGTIRHVQKQLADALRERAAPDRLLHIPVTVQMAQGSNRESTHRTRSFLFAALGAAMAEMFDLSRVRFYENGIVSLNLPPSGQVVGARATRSTHPQALRGFSRLFSALFDREVRVDNPFFWKTKTEIVQTVRDLGGQDLIRRTRSCGAVRRMTEMHPHCGLCSQCIDRRFAMLAAGLETEDPAEAYEVDPLRGARSAVGDREIALGYVRNARRFAAAKPGDFLRTFGELQRAPQWMDEPADRTVERLFLLHKRHGAIVRKVLDGLLAEAQAAADVPQAFDPGSLVMLAGRDIFSGDAAETSVSTVAQQRMAEDAGVPRRWLMRLGAKPDRVEIDGLGELKGVAAGVLHDLAKEHLLAAGQGLDREDYPFRTGHALATAWAVDEETVRRRIFRIRKRLRALSAALGVSAPLDDAIIESLPWQGYRLNPDSVRVVRDAERPRG